MASLLGTYPSFAVTEHLFKGKTPFESLTVTGLANHPSL